MKEEQRVSGEFDVVSGASNSINQSMLPLALKLEPSLSEVSGQKYYSIAEEIAGGLTGSLKVVLDEGKITSVRYDEIMREIYGFRVIYYHEFLSFFLCEFISMVNY